MKDANRCRLSRRFALWLRKLHFPKGIAARIQERAGLSGLPTRRRCVTDDRKRTDQQRDCPSAVDQPIYRAQPYKSSSRKLKPPTAREAVSVAMQQGVIDVVPNRAATPMPRPGLQYTSSIGGLLFADDSRLCSWHLDHLYFCCHARPGHSRLPSCWINPLHPRRSKEWAALPAASVPRRSMTSRSAPSRGVAL